jgi:elongation factor P
MIRYIIEKTSGVTVPKSSELKKGDVVEIDDSPHVVKLVEVRSPSSRGASTLYKIRFTNLLTGQKRDESLKGDDMFQAADCQRVPVQFSYIDGDHYMFMNTEDYSQYGLSASSLDGQLEYLYEGLEGLTALLVEGDIAAIDLPQSVVLEIIETAPSIKGATASSRTKPATLATGLVIQVPEYVAQGESVKVNTSNGKFMSRG